MDEDSLQHCDWKATAGMELLALDLWCNMKESTIAQMRQYNWSTEYTRKVG